MEEYNEEDYVICPYCGNDIGDLPSESFSLSAGSVLKERYIVGRVLGNGGFGITYIGYDKSLQRRIAIKEYFPTECASRQNGELAVEPYSGERGERYATGLESFAAEARRLANLTSIEGVVDVYDVFKENNTAYIVMEYLSGETVKEMLNRRKTLGFGTTMNIIIPVLQSLIKVHEEGLIHRDISPENIMRTTQGKIVLIDFGASRNNSLSVSKSLSVILKPGYAPIEQYDNKLDQASWTDVYATAATMYKMLTGVTPENSNSRLLSDTLLPVSELREGLPPELDNILAKALAVRPEERTQTAKEFLDELLTLKDPKKVKKAPQPKPQKNVSTKTVAKQPEPSSAKDPRSDVWKSYVHERPIETSVVSEMEYKTNTLTGDKENLNIPQVKKEIVNAEKEEEKESSGQSTAVKLSKPLIFVTVCAFIILAILVGMGYMDRKNTLDVPDFTGMNIDSVLANSEYDFDFDVTYVYSPDTDLDVIIEQSPGGETRRVKKGSQVRLTVNSTQTEVTVPVLSNLSQSTAIKTLDSLYLESEIQIVQDDSVEEGCVIKTEPANGSRVHVLSKVTVYVAENSVPAPDLVGKLYEEAAAELESLELQMGEVTYEYSDQFDAGYIISQGVTKDSPLQKGSAIPVVISCGKPYDVSISETIDLSSLKPQFKVTVMCNGVTESEKTFYTLAFRSTYDFEITRLNTTGTVPVNVYIDGELFAEYEFNFNAGDGYGTSTLINTYEVSATKKPGDEGDSDQEDNTSSDKDKSSSGEDKESSKASSNSKSSSSSENTASEKLPAQSVIAAAASSGTARSAGEDT